MLHFSQHHLMTAALIISTVVALPSFSAAQAAYKWTDPSGVVFYGTKPPVGARNVQKVQPKNYSRYSSSRAMKPYSSPLFRKPDSRAGLKPLVKESDLVQPLEPEPINSPSVPEQNVKLESAKPELKLAGKDEISSCRVTVTNTSLIDIEGIQVAFEFPDGTLITADGPSRLNAKQGAIYSIPPENLPLILAPGTKPEPKVLVNSDADA